MAMVQEASAQTLDTSALLNAFIDLKRGDFTVRLPRDWTGIAGKVADTFNEVVEQNQRMAQELDRLSRVVGKEGKLSQRASMGDVSGSWADAIDSVNELINDLVHPTSEAARVIGYRNQKVLKQFQEMATIAMIGQIETGKQQIAAMAQRQTAMSTPNTQEKVTNQLQNQIGLQQGPGQQTGMM